MSITYDKNFLLHSIQYIFQEISYYILPAISHGNYDCLRFWHDLIYCFQIGRTLAWVYHLLSSITCYFIILFAVSFTLSLGPQWLLFFLVNWVKKAEEPVVFHHKYVTQTTYIFLSISICIILYGGVFNIIYCEVT